MINLRKEILNYISGQRYEHTLAVEEECVKLAEIFKLNQTETDKLRIAALLHDITKELDVQEQVVLCERFNIVYSGFTPKLFHAPTGASLARNDFPTIVDDLVYNAIRLHTTGGENMNLFEKLLYLADYIEPTRTFPDCKRLRKYFYKTLSLNDTLILSFDMTIENLITNKEHINIKTIKARNFLLEQN